MAESSRSSSDLRELLLAPADAERLDAHGRTEAAVLVPMHGWPRNPGLVFTERRSDLNRHAGEISFPGGRKDDGDSDLSVTALREAHEEIGLPPGDVELIGALQPTPTIATNYAVYPFVGLIEPGHEWTPSATEVSAVLELSLDDLRAGYERQRMLRRGIPFRTDVYVVDDNLIWGATARMLTDLFERLDATASP